jgi:hypothetical protein
MATTLLVLSIVFFITTFGIHSLIAKGNIVNRPMYLSTPFVVVPWISGLILTLIPVALLCDYSWLIIIIVNTIFVFLAGPFITTFYLSRLSTGVLGKDMVYSFGLGVLTLTIGMLLYHS